MDNSHVALVSLKLVHDQFESYRCDRNMPLGVNVSLPDICVDITLATSVASTRVLDGFYTY